MQGDTEILKAASFIQIASAKSSFQSPECSSKTCYQAAASGHTEGPSVSIWVCDGSQHHTMPNSLHVIRCIMDESWTNHGHAYFDDIYRLRFRLQAVWSPAAIPLALGNGRLSSAVFQNRWKHGEPLDSSPNTYLRLSAQFFIKLAVSYHELNRPDRLKISS